MTNNETNDQACDQMAQQIRDRAQQRYQQNLAQFKLLETQQAKELLESLSVYQIELEMQNEDLQQTQVALEQANNQYRQLYNEAPVGYLTATSNGQICLANTTLAKLLETSTHALVTDGINGFCLDPDAFYLHCRQTINNGMSTGHVLQLVTSSNKTLTVHIQSKPVLPPIATLTNEQISEQISELASDNQLLIHSNIIDITDKIELERQVNQNRNLESIGILAGGIAHDFNNVLATTLANIEMALLQIPADHGAAGNLNNAVKAMLHGKGLTNQLLTFARGSDPIKQLVALDILIKEMVTFILHGTAIKALFEIPTNLWMVDIDPAQIKQVVQNILINACQAIKTHGTITINGCNIADGKDVNPALLAIPYLKITITDTGCGIPANIIDKIFTPYYSTKDTGNGLGLAIVHSIIKKHRGDIQVTSIVNQGTTFSIYLPASIKTSTIQIPAAPSHTPVTPTPANLTILATSETKIATILLMYDEPMMIDIINSALVLKGYQVVSASHGEQALQLYKQHLEQGQPFDLVILDLTISGGMGGKETIAAILAMAPTAKAIVSSGYSKDPVMANYSDFGFAAALAKPFQLAKLEAIVKEVLAKDNSPN